MSGQGGVPLSTAPRPGQGYDPANESQYRRAVAQDLGRLQEAVKSIRTSSQQEYTSSNVTEDRTFNADSTTTAELADILGTLISDLQDAGLIG